MTSTSEQRQRGLRRRLLTLVAGAVLIFGSVVACAPDASSGDQASSKEIVFFGLTTQNPYIAQQTDSAREEAKKLGYTLRSVTNNFDAAQLQQQIQQEVASGTKPAAYIIFALDQQAAINQARQLSQIAPVFQINQSVAPEAFEYVKAYVGPDDVLIGRTAGETLMSLRDSLISKGVQLHSPKGNLLAISAEPGLETTKLRWQGLSEALKSAPMNVLENSDCCSDPENAYNRASQLVPKYKSQLDFVFTQSVDSAAGVVKALKENGLTPGKDVWVVTGNCGGLASLLESGDVYGAGAQLPNVEGAAMVQVIAQYVNAGEVRKGTATVEYTTEAPPLSQEPPTQINYLSNPAMIGPESINGVAWGKTYGEGCPLS